MLERMQGGQLLGAQLVHQRPRAWFRAGELVKDVGRDHRFVGHGSSRATEPRPTCRPAAPLDYGMVTHQYMFEQFAGHFLLIEYAVSSRREAWCRSARHATSTGY